MSIPASLPRIGAAVFLLLGLGACGSSGFGGDAGLGGNSPPRVPITESRAGTQQHVVLSSPVDGVDVSFEVFEPDQLVAGQSYPLVLEGHGYGGARQTARAGFIARLTEAGYYVISIDQRGFGASGGTVRVMGPDTEGQDLVAILDWAEELPGLKRRGNGEMMVGSYGGSYGGMYQLLLAGTDPRQRLRVMAPDITPHNLVYALNPQDVIKSGWALALVAGGEASALTSLVGGTLPAGLTNQDTAIVETLLQGALSNVFPEPGKAFFDYHSVSYFCRGEAAAEQNFLLASPDPRNVPPRPFAPVDVLVTQGFLDTLFNFNDGLNNFECLKARGGDVRLLTHQSGHILPVGVPPAVENALDPFYAALTLPGFQDAGGSRSCGSLNLNDVQFAWFEEKLQGKAGAVDAALPIGDKPCISLAEGDAIAVNAVRRGGPSFAINDSVPQFNSVLGVVGSLLGTQARELMVANQTLMTVPDTGAILAGLPLLDITLAPVGGLGLDSCPTPLALGACDPILFIGLGRRMAGDARWDLIDDQITPVRGFGAHQIEMNGIAERLAPGEEIGLLVFGFHAQFPISWSRDLVLPAMGLSGSVQLPLLQASDIVAEGL
jgi:ABC-2 type transport system ATP-binding protein